MSAASYSDPHRGEARQEGSPNMVNRLDSTIRESIAGSKRFVEDQVSEHPTSAVLLSFVVGAGVGAMVGTALFDQYARRQMASTGLVARLTDSVTRAVSESLPESLKRS